MSPPPLRKFTSAVGVDPISNAEERAAVGVSRPPAIRY